MSLNQGLSCQFRTRLLPLFNYRPLQGFMPLFAVLDGYMAVPYNYQVVLGGYSANSGSNSLEHSLVMEYSMPLGSVEPTDCYSVELTDSIVGS